MGMMVMITSVQVMMRRNGTISCAEFALMLQVIDFIFASLTSICQVCASCSDHESKIDF